ncbi:flagellar basal body rod protein FlgC [Bacillus sp. CGMCC 1.16541]|uniref:flagellar basal body rod protein FlgC n=1 Tax=Bacillus sp. CGMCC 1.16541 TaxID=2185143 RepID=UPI000D72A27A|nr:flagellar basal body rod protein FlgC [Bacillus sp. CGMCC 1.16541]
MTIFHSMNTTASGLTAQRLRMDVISSNMANIDTTRAKNVDGQWEPYRRKMVVTSPKDQNFATVFRQALSGKSQAIGSGVKVTSVVEDESPFKLVYNPQHPDADEQGYVQMPNVDPLKEMADLISATRSYEANITVLNSTKNMLIKTLEIGK